MKRYLGIWLFICTIILQPEIGCKPGYNIDDSPLTICTFNIAWLGDGNSNDVIARTDDDYKHIADIIKESGADIIGLQEIENTAALDKLSPYLEEYSYSLGVKGNSQNVGVLHKKNIHIESLGEYMPLAINIGRNRPGFMVSGKKGNFDFTMMIVHLKSTSRYDSTDALRTESRSIRKQQATFIASWIDSVIQNGREQDVFVIGDFNDFPKREKEPTLTPLLQSNSYSFLTSDLKSCKYAKLYGIDHILASTKAINRYIPGSERIINIQSMYDEATAGKISDHCPVIMQFDTQQPDND